MCQEIGIREGGKDARCEQIHIMLKRDFEEMELVANKLMRN